MSTSFDPNSNATEKQVGTEALNSTAEFNQVAESTEDPLTFLRSRTQTSGESESETNTESAETESPPQPKLKFAYKVMLNAIALASLPVIALGITASLWVNTSIQSLKSEDDSAAIAQIEPLNTQLPLLFGIGALCSGAIAAFIAKRSARPVIEAAERSNTIINRLDRSDLSLRDRVEGNHELIGLRHNLEALETKIPSLLTQKESASERFQKLMGITQKIRGVLTEQEVFRTAVDEIRAVFRADRVAIYRLDSDIDGTIIEESVSPGFPKMLWTVLEDPCLADYLDYYKQGRIRAIHDIHNSGLDDCHIGLLDRFGIKANLVAPILKGDDLFGMIIVNQCSKPRTWLSHEIELLSQLTGQISFAIDFVRLLEETTQQVDQNQILVNMLRKVRETLNEDQILETTVTEWRKTLRAERVMVYGFDEKWYGTVLAEDVVPGVPKAIHAEIYDPCFAEGYVEKYRAGRVQAVNDISNAGLTKCHLQQLEPYQVKANLIAPILKGDQLFGLLIAHTCKAPRQWQSWEIDLHGQLATQVGYALEHARLLKRLDTDMTQMQQLITLSKTISRSLDESEILSATVEQVRKVLQTDRVMVYQFDSDWYGTVVAESVVPGYPKALWAKIKDPCFAQGFIAQYQEGRVQAVNDIYKADLTPCHIQQLEPFSVKANLVAPILKDGKLSGLLIAHECNKPREWQPQDISLMRQISLQVGIVLDHARLLAQVEASYQASKLESESQQSRSQSLEQEMSQWITQSQQTATGLEETAVKQLDAVTQVYQDLKANSKTAQEAQEVFNTLHSSQSQVAAILSETSQKAQQLSSILEAIHHSHSTLAAANQTRDTLGQQSGGQFNTLKDITSQLKLQAMNSALEAARVGDAGQEFANIGEQVLNLTRQLDAELVTIQPLIHQWHSSENELWADVTDNTEHLEHSIQQIQSLLENCDRLLKINAPIEEQAQALSKLIDKQIENNTGVNEEFLDLAGHIRQTSEQALTISNIIASWSQSHSKEG